MSLREKLIEVLYDEGTRPANVAAELADSVIDALGLKQVWMTPESERLGIIVRNKPDEAFRTRYLSDWFKPKKDEEHQGEELSDRVFKAIDARFAETEFIPRKYFVKDLTDAVMEVLNDS
mgnify:CR=1 FL=1